MPSEYETVITDQMEYGTVITTQGAAIIADCILNGTKLPIVEAGAGDGGGAPTVPVPSQTALVNERWRGEIVGKELSSTTPNMIDVKIVIGDDVGGFTIREMGLFSDTGVLIAVCNTPDTEKVPISGGVSGKLTMIMHIVVADASVLEFVINSSLDAVNPEDMEKALKGHNTNPEAHPDLQARMRATEIALNGSETISGNGDPTAETKGVIGQHYINSATGEEFVCTGVTEEGCIWEPLEAVKAVAQGLPLKAVTEEEYNALSEAEKAADVAYLVTDDAQDNPELPPPWNSQNQLDNSYWASKDAIVNQMGQEEYQIRNYTIDRWILGWNPDYTPDGAKVTISDGYLEWEGKESWLIQRFPGLALTGKLLTLSVLLADGTLCSGSAVYDPADAYAPYFKEQKMYAYAMDDETEGLWRVVLVNTSEAPLQMVAAKLELGDRQTLARRDADGSWVLNDPPPNKALELAKCQRYMIAISAMGDLYSGIGWGAPYSASNVVIDVPTPVTMRARPTVKMSGAWELRGAGTAVSFNALEHHAGVGSYSESTVSVDIGNFSGLNANRLYCLLSYNDPTAKVILDANL